MKNRLKKILFVMAVMLVLIAVVFGWLSDLRALQRKACHANMRILAAFIEAYNKTHVEKIATLTPESIDKLRADFAEKKQASQAHQLPGDMFVCPSNSEDSYSSVGDLTRLDGIIQCYQHGANEPSQQLAEKY